MKYLLLIIEVFSFFLYCRSCFLHPQIDKFDGPTAIYNLSVSYLGPLETIRKYGYLAEAHTVQTEDGYLLQLHRIPKGKKGDAPKRGPILLQHGFSGSSLNFLHLEPERGLPFLLADLGYDVWFGNFRGNTYSKAHIFYAPCDTKFWDYSWEESGLYDVPATIDFILEFTNSTKLQYIGHSMGTTAFLVMLSMKPEYNDKIAKGHLLGPAIFLKNMKSPLLKYIAPLTSTVNFLTKTFTTGALITDNNLVKFLSRVSCSVAVNGKNVCTNLIYLVMGEDSEQFDESLMGTIVFHYPAGYSMKALIHFAQLYSSGDFRQYDYGFAKNIIQYSSPTPPSYPLGNITAPIFIHVGQNDYLSTVEDVKTLVEKMPSIINVNIIKYKKFNHFDFLIGKHVKSILYDKLIEDILK